MPETQIAELLGERKTELLVTVLGLLATIGTALLEGGMLQTGTAAYLVVSIVVMVVSYVLQRGWVKAGRAKAIGAHTPLRPSEGAASIKTHIRPIEP